MYTHFEVDESTLTQVMALGAFASKKAAINSALVEMAKLLKRRELLAHHVAAAKLYRQCRAKGVTVRSTIDCLIAQLCIRDNLPLLAKDRDFTQMAKVVPLVMA